MNDEEKCYEAFRITNWIYDIHMDVHEDVCEKFARGTRFPYFQRYTVKDDKNNEWILTYMCPSKEKKRKSMYLCMCYTIYEIPPKRKENNSNSGKGILLFDPVAMHKRIESGGRMVAFMDIVPHAFNRYTERYLRPKGKDNIEFIRKVESMFARFMHFDVQADMYGDRSSEKHKEEGVIPYDIYMYGGGMLRGQFINSILIRFYTYVSEDMMYHNQIERQEAMQKEHYRWKREGKKN